MEVLAVQGLVFIYQCLIQQFIMVAVVGLAFMHKVVVRLAVLAELGVAELGLNLGLDRLVQLTQAEAVAEEHTIVHRLLAAQ